MTLCKTTWYLKLSTTLFLLLLLSLAASQSVPRGEADALSGDPGTDVTDIPKGSSTEGGEQAKHFTPGDIITSPIPTKISSTNEAVESSMTMKTEATMTMSAATTTAAFDRDKDVQEKVSDPTETSSSTEEIRDITAVTKAAATTPPPSPTTTTTTMTMTIPVENEESGLSMGSLDNDVRDDARNLKYYDSLRGEVVDSEDRPRIKPLFSESEALGDPLSVTCSMSGYFTKLKPAEGVDVEKGMLLYGGEDCAELCRESPVCEAVVVEITNNQCWFVPVADNLVKDDHYHYARKFCVRSRTRASPASLRQEDFGGNKDYVDADVYQPLRSSQNSIHAPSPLAVAMVATMLGVMTLY